MSKALILLGFLTLAGCNSPATEDKADYLERAWLSQTLIEKQYTSKYIQSLEAKDTIQAEIYRDSANMASYCADVAYDEMEKCEIPNNDILFMILGIVIGYGVWKIVEKIFF